MKRGDHRTKDQLLDENENLRVRLAEAEQTLEAIRSGEVDALVVKGPEGERVFSLTGAEHIYRVIAETMHEAALNVDPDGTILFCNQRFCDLMKTPMNEVLGRKVGLFVSRPQEQPLKKVLADVLEGPVQRRLTLRASDGTVVPVQISASLIEDGSNAGVCLLVSDLSELEASAKSIRVLREHQQALEESEHRFRAIFESSKDAILIASDAGTLIQANPSAAEIFGQTAEQMMGQHISKFVCDGFESPAAWEAFLTSGLFYGEGRFTDCDGHQRHLECSAVAAIMEGRHLFVLRDITERKQAEEEILRSREWLRVVLSSIGDAVMAVDTEGLITFLNPVAASLTGWQPAEAIGRSVEEVFRIVNEKTGEPAEDIVKKVLLEGRVFNLANHTALIDRGGRQIPIEDSAAPIRDPAGKVFGVVLVFRDFTEKRRAQVALRQSEQRFRLALRNAPVSVAAQDRNLRYTWGYNQKTAQPEEIIGRSDYEIFTPEEAAHITAIKRRVLEEGVELRERMWFNRPGGRIFLDVSWEPIRDEDGRTVGVASATVDLTSLKNAEEELRRSRDELELRVQERTAELRKAYAAQRAYTVMLEQSNRDLEEFAYVASHDLQEPVRKIQAIADRIAGLGIDSLDSKARDYLERMQQAAARMQDLVLSLLRYSRVTSWSEPASLTDLKETVGEALADLGVLCEEAKCRVEIDELPNIEANKVQIRQLFQNLIENSLKYRSDGGAFVKIYSVASGSDDFVEIHVQDNGIGFDESNLDNIFKPFRRLHKKDSQYKGTGIGLAICRKIVEGHGGAITARSSPGKGSTFILKMPRKQLKQEDMT